MNKLLLTYSEEIYKGKVEVFSRIDNTDCIISIYYKEKLIYVYKLKIIYNSKERCTYNFIDKRYPDIFFYLYKRRKDKEYYDKKGILYLVSILNRSELKYIGLDSLSKEHIFIFSHVISILFKEKKWSNNVDNPITIKRNNGEVTYASAKEKLCANCKFRKDCITRLRIDGICNEYTEGAAIKDYLQWG